MVWRSLRELPVWVRFFVLGRFIKSTGSLAFLYMAVYLVQERGLDATAAGIVVGANGVGILVGSLCGGWIGDRFGLRRTMILSNLGMAVGALLIPFVPVAGLGPVVAFSGLIGGMAFPLGMALVAGSIPPEQRRAGVALSRAAMNAGVVVGPPLGALAAVYDFRIVFLMECVAGLTMVLIIWRFVPRPQPQPARAQGPGMWRAVLADRPMWMLLLAVLAVDAAYRQVFTALPLMLTDNGVDLVGYGALIAGSSLLIVIAETPLAIRLAHLPALRIIPLGYTFIGLGFLVLVFSQSYAAAIVCIGLITVGEMLYKPTSAAFAADRAPEGMQGRYQSLYSSASICGMVVSPPIGGALYQHAPGLLWPTCVALAFVGAVALGFASRRSSADPPSATPASATLASATPASVSAPPPSTLLPASPPSA